MEQFLMTFAYFLFAAVVVEKLTEIIGNRLVKVDKKNLSIIIGMVVALYANFNLMELVGIPFGWGTDNMIVLSIAGIVGVIFSGLILSGGANGVHDFLSKLQKTKEIRQVELEMIKADERDPVDITENISTGRIVSDEIPYE